MLYRVLGYNIEGTFIDDKISYRIFYTDDINIYTCSISSEKNIYCDIRDTIIYNYISSERGIGISKYIEKTKLTTDIVNIDYIANQHLKIRIENHIGIYPELVYPLDINLNIEDLFKRKEYITKCAKF